MSERKDKLRTRLDETRAMLNTVLDQVGDRAEMQVYSDGLGWTVRQIVAHLADAERGHYNQITTIAEGNELIPPDFDIERYNQRVTEKTAAKPIEQSRAELAEWREKLLAWLETVDEDKLDRQGRHASLQIMTVHDIVRMVHLHERGHTTDLARALGVTLT